ncbi:MAG: LamG domain-containing protein, partial [Anaerolineales bacterium]|nr:LamG domain-containing protein [Anaerolineales bacterium]
TILKSHNVIATPYPYLDPSQDAFYDTQIGQHVGHGIPVYGDHDNDGSPDNLNQQVRYTFIYNQGNSPTADNYSMLFVDYHLESSQLHSLDYEYQGGAYDGLRLGPGTLGMGDGHNPLRGQMQTMAFYNGDVYQSGSGLDFVDDMADGRYLGYPWDPRFPTLVLFPSRYNSNGSEDHTVAYVDEVDEIGRADCYPDEACPSSINGQYSEAIFFDGVDDYLDAGASEFAKGDYTISGWFSTTGNASQHMPIFTATDPNSGNTAVSLYMDTSGQIVYKHDIGTAAYNTSSAQNDGAWHHFTAVRQNGAGALYIDGQLVSSTNPNGGTTATDFLDLALGVEEIAANTFISYTGALDEFVLLPAAVDEDGVQMLMDSLWPAIEIDEPFVPFALNPLTGQVVSGTAVVDPTTYSSLHTIDQEVEAAIELQQAIVIPPVDNTGGTLHIYAPFEEVPGDAQFDDLMRTDPLVCAPASACPLAGFRGMLGRAALFDGDDDLLRVAPIFNNTSNYLRSYAMWIKAERGVIFDTRTSNADTGIEFDFDKLIIYSSTNNSDHREPYFKTELPLNLPEGEWSHIVITVAPWDNTVRLYLNGTLYDSVVYSGYDPYLGGLTLGGNAKGGNYFSGYLDDFRAYETFLNAGTIQTLFEGSSPVLRFEFDEEADATQFADSSPNNFVGVPASSTSANNGETMYNPQPGTDGRIGNTAVFQTDMGPLTITDPGNSDLDLANELTIMFWVNPSEVGTGWQNLVSKHAGGGNRNYQAVLAPNTTELHFSHQRSDCSSYFGQLTSSDELPLNQWTHVAVTFNGTSNQLYLNGQLDDSNTFTARTLCQNNEPVRIGGGYAGQMDEFAMYSRTMSSAEVFSFYQRELRWYRARGGQQIRIDTDNPAVE